MEITKELHDRLELLNAKYQAIGQDLLSYLDGLLYADVTTYWDYIELDTLLSLQKPKTKFPDEVVFIIYHQITELYFKLVLQEFKALGEIEATSGFFAATFWTWDNLIVGMWQVLPLVIVSYGVGLTVEFLFAVIKGHEVEEGYLVTGMLVPLIVPIDIPLWM